MKKQIEEDELLVQMAEFGFLPEDLPECFDSSQFSRNISMLQTKVENKAIITAPTTISIFKNEGSRRIMSIPNPESFLILSKFIQKNWKNIVTNTESSHSTSSITSYHTYNHNKMEFETINSENMRRKKRFKNTFSESQKFEASASMGYRYKLSVDISKFYDTVYTHSIGWAVCGKKEVKKQMRCKSGNGDGPCPSGYEWVNDFDKYTRALKNNETNGIVTGPFTSRIFSEIILSKIDRDLEDDGFIFSRYVDDYSFYFNSQFDANSGLPKISSRLKEYDLNINESKTEISLFPFKRYVDLPNEMRSCSQNMKDILCKAMSLESDGVKGAHKYALKYIK